MSASPDRTIPAPGELVVRRIPFEFPDDIEPHWKPDEPEWSHMINAASLTMPYLEPFLIDSMREALSQIDDERLREEAKGFMAQEGQHYRQHRRYNELLKSKGYPELAEVERDMQASYDRIRKHRSLGFRMGYTAGFETMTLGVTKWLVEQRRDLFQGADPRVASFVLWHMVEETEHKRAAYNLYQAACPGYWMRVLGIFVGPLHLIKYTQRAYKVMLKKDGRWSSLSSRLKLWKRGLQFFAAVLPFALRASLPGHDPEDEPDSTWVREWIKGYALADSDGPAPLIDTLSSDMPVPFAQQA